MIEKAVGNLAVVEVNKVAKGDFVIRVEGVEAPIVCLEGMTRPYPALKALNMDEVVRKVLDVLKARG
jgi:DUF917 family protein